MTTGDAIAGDTVTMSSKAVRSEMLCFMKNKPSNVLPFDTLVELCYNFYTVDEVEQARLLLSQLQTQHRLPKHKGTEGDKKKRSVNDIARACLDPSLNLPVFYAVELSRLPPVGIEHVDISVLMTEVANLRAEVRAMVAIKEELVGLRTAVVAMNSEVVGHVRRDIMSLTAETQVIDSGSRENTVLDPAQPAAKASAAAVVAEAARSGALDLQNQKKKKTTKSVVGNANNGKLRVVEAKRTVHVFVSRLDPATSADEVIDCVQDVLDNFSDESDDNKRATVSKDSIKCFPLSTKHNTYSSFHIAVSVSGTNVKTVSEMLMSSDMWPAGVFVRKYFVNKQ